MDQKSKVSRIPGVYRIYVFFQVLFHSIFMAIHEFFIWLPGFTRLYLFLRGVIYAKRPPRSYQQVSLSRNSTALHEEYQINLFEDRHGFRLVIGDPVVTTVKSRQEIHTSDPPNQTLSVVNDRIVSSIKEDTISFQLGRSSDDWSWTEVIVEHEFTHVFGLSEKFGMLDKQGKEWKFWNIDKVEMEPRDDPLYKSYPIAIARGQTSWFAIIIDYPGYQKWDLRKQNQLRIDIAYDGLIIDFVFASDPKQLMTSITSILGKMPLPPRWSLGFHQCRWSYNTADKIRSIGRGFRSRDIPCDALYLDIDYMDGFKIFTWDSEQFGDLPQLVRDIHQEGFKVITMIDPGIKKEKGYDIYDQLVLNDFCVKYENGKIYQSVVWPGRSVFPDYFNSSVQKWWGGLYKEFIELGIDGFWNDMNEPTVFNLRGTMSDNAIHIINDKVIEHQYVHNLYGQQMVKASYDGLSSLYGDRRFFLLSRAGYLGSQQYGWIWTGDNKSSWIHLQQSIPKLLNSGLSGHFASGADIGGFRKIPSPELFARWMALGVFYPFMRNHTIKFSEDQEPWTFDDEVTEISRKFIRLRYLLTPYTYTWFRIGCDQGIPLLRPMWMEFPGNDGCYEMMTMNSQFMFGPSLLVAPMLWKKKTTRSVYLPSGKWYDFFNDTCYDGDQILDLSAELDQIILLVRENSIIPVYEEIGGNMEETVQNPIHFKKYGNDAKGLLYLDDGTTTKYKNGEYGLYRIDNDLNQELIEGKGYPM